MRSSDDAPFHSVAFFVARITLQLTTRANYSPKILINFLNQKLGDSMKSIIFCLVTVSTLAWGDGVKISSELGPQINPGATAMAIFRSTLGGDDLNRADGQWKVTIEGFPEKYEDTVDVKFAKNCSYFFASYSKLMGHYTPLFFPVYPDDAVEFFVGWKNYELKFHFTKVTKDHWVGVAQTSSHKYKAAFDRIGDSDLQIKLTQAQIMAPAIEDNGTWYVHDVAHPGAGGCAITKPGIDRKTYALWELNGGASSIFDEQYGTLSTSYIRYMANKPDPKWVIVDGFRKQVIDDRTVSFLTDDGRFSMDFIEPSAPRAR
jgi:hypothetical protein